MGGQTAVAGSGAERRVGDPARSAAITGTSVARSHFDAAGADTQVSGASFPVRIASAMSSVAMGPSGAPST